MAKCLIFWDPKISAYRMKMSSGDYKKIEGTVSFLKKTIPHSDRDYQKIQDPLSMKEEHVWTFIEKYLDGTVQFCKLIWGQQEVAVLTRSAVEGQSRQQSLPTSQKISGLDSVLLEFVKLLPFDAAQKAYRTASLSLHPDRGGSMEQMSKLNAAWSRIEKEVYHQ